jgi:hypothetical protein
MFYYTVARQGRLGVVLEFANSLNSKKSKQWSSSFFIARMGISSFKNLF